MAIIQRIRQSKQCFYTVLLLALSMLNGLYSQSYSAIVTSTQDTHVANTSHVQHDVTLSEDFEHQTAQNGDCGLDASCKIKCAWHCQLMQTMQPLHTSLSYSYHLSNPLPAYPLNFAYSARSDQGLRPPIA